MYAAMYSVPGALLGDLRGIVASLDEILSHLGSISPAPVYSVSATKTGPTASGRTSLHKDKGFHTSKPQKSAQGLTPSSH